MTTNNHKQRLTLFMNSAITKHAKAQAIVEETTLTSLVEKALIRYLPKETIVRKAVIREEVN